MDPSVWATFGLAAPGGIAWRFGSASMPSGLEPHRASSLETSRAPGPEVGAIVVISPWTPMVKIFGRIFPGEKFEVYCKSKLSYAFFNGLNAILECFEQVYGEVVHCKLNLNLVVYRMSSEHEQTEIAFWQRFQVGNSDQKNDMLPEFFFSLASRSFNCRYHVKRQWCPEQSASLWDCFGQSHCAIAKYLSLRVARQTDDLTLWPHFCSCWAVEKHLYWHRFERNTAENLLMQRISHFGDEDHFQCG